MRILLICTFILIPGVIPAGEREGKTARERYEAGLQKLRQTYESEVQAEIRAATARGNEIEVNRLANERATINDTPAESLKKKVLNTTWMFDDGGFVTFLKGGKATNNKGEDIEWSTTDGQTLIHQNTRTFDLYVWNFSLDAESVTRHTFRFQKDSARTPRKSPKLLLRPPEDSDQAQDLNQKIVSFCKWKLGKKVGNGVCSTFVTNAVVASGGRLWYRNERGGTDFKWGKQVYYRERNQSETKSSGDYQSILPGDIIEFRGCRLSGKGWWVSFASHVAVIVATKSEGRILKIMHSNYSGNPNVQASMIDIRTLEKGSFRVYRPQPTGKK